MTDILSLESANWVVPDHPDTFTSTLPTYAESLPMHVKREGVQNYIKNRGSLNLGDWAIEGRRSATPRMGRGEREPFDGQAIPAKVKGPEAIRNYIRSVSSTPNLLHGNLQPPNPHHGVRVRPEGQANYIQDHDSRVKILLESYGRNIPTPVPTRPHTQGELATDLYYTHQKGHMGRLLNEYGRFPASARPMPHVKTQSARDNLARAQGTSHILENRMDFRPPTLDPHVSGVQAHENFDKAQGSAVNRLFHSYGHLPISARAIPKVKRDGVQNYDKARGDSMRKIIGQSPPSHRLMERPMPVAQWP